MTYFNCANFKMIEETTQTEVNDSQDATEKEPKKKAKFTIAEIYVKMETKTLSYDEGMDALESVIDQLNEMKDNWYSRMLFVFAQKLKQYCKDHLERERLLIISIAEQNGIDPSILGLT